MVGNILKLLFGTKFERDVKKFTPVVQKINEIEESYQSLPDDDVRAKTDEFKKRLAEGETLDDIMPEAFATVKNVCRRLCGTSWDVCDHPVAWDMVPFDVQLIGAIVLHKGKIAEMATGEGKTLVATMPLYLNVLSGKNAHLVTVNDYLAKRDSEWMGKVYEMLGVTVGCIQHDMSPQERKAEYAKDITYGTNSEFGFDYLRDNGLALSYEDCVQRGHNYAIVDEVDSILIDEARTPLIISGPSSVSSHVYDKLKPVVQDLVRKQTLLCNRLLKEVKEQYDKEGITGENEEIIGKKLFQVQIGTPRNKPLSKMIENPQIRRLMDKIDGEFHSDLRKKDLPVIKEEMLYIIEEKQHSVDLTEKGRDTISPGKPEEYMLPDIITMYQEIDGNEAFSDDEKEVKKQELQTYFDTLSERIHNLSQLLRAYSLFEKDVEYVVQDNRVMIVDEFTGRLMPGRRYSDGLHQALEAKEGVEIERETQTFATITIQNYFRMYDKLAGMTGTAVTEANEFSQTYKLDVCVIPTNRPIMRKDNQDVIYKTKREKYNAIVDDIASSYSEGQPVLVGTVSVESSEVLSRLLKRRAVPHNVLNAKYHQKEAEIVSLAGQRGAVTIATNMDGRGTDIKLGPGVLMKDEKTEDVSGGLCVIGTGRHEARRIDLQLRGRCARQGDPGQSRFYVSLEDDLMRLFGSDKIARVMERIGIEEGQELTHPLLSRSIETAQKRVEERNFSIRKHTLEYDDVMNKQREVIYNYRMQVLENEDLKELLDEMIDEVLEETIEEYASDKTHPSEWDIEGLCSWFNQTFRAVITYNPEENYSKSELNENFRSEIDKLYVLKVKYEGEEMVQRLLQYVKLTTIDRLWQEHLYNMDSLREGIGLRAYGQTDPLIAYKQEAFTMFSEMMSNIKTDIVSSFFKVAMYVPKEEETRRKVPTQLIHQEVSGLEMSSEEQMERAGQAQESRHGAMRPEGAALTPVKRESEKIGRNDPCPCGSGKKYKKCCGAGNS